MGVEVGIHVREGGVVGGEVEDEDEEVVMMVDMVGVKKSMVWVGELG